MNGSKKNKSNKKKNKNNNTKRHNRQNTNIKRSPGTDKVESKAPQKEPTPQVTEPETPVAAETNSQEATRETDNTPHPSDPSVDETESAFLQKQLKQLHHIQEQLDKVITAMESHGNNFQEVEEKWFSQILGNVKAIIPKVDQESGLVRLKVQEIAHTLKTLQNQMNATPKSMDRGVQSIQGTITKSEAGIKKEIKDKFDGIEDDLEKIQKALKSLPKKNEHPGILQDISDDVKKIQKTLKKQNTTQASPASQQSPDQERLKKLMEFQKRIHDELTLTAENFIDSLGTIEQQEGQIATLQSKLMAIEKELQDTKDELSQTKFRLENAQTEVTKRDQKISELEHNTKSLKEKHTTELNEVKQQQDDRFKQFKDTQATVLRKQTENLLTILITEGSLSQSIKDELNVDTLDIDTHEIRSEEDFTDFMEAMEALENCDGNLFHEDILEKLKSGYKPFILTRLPYVGHGSVLIGGSLEWLPEEQNEQKESLEESTDSENTPDKDSDTENNTENEPDTEGLEEVHGDVDPEDATDADDGIKDTDVAQQEPEGAETEDTKTEESSNQDDEDEQ